MSPPVFSPLGRILALYKEIEPAEFVLRTDICTVGRSPLCQVAVQMETVSRLHARIEFDGAVYVLYDFASANGTYVNGQRIDAPHRLQDGDLIGLGSAQAVLRFMVSLQEASHLDRGASA